MGHIVTKDVTHTVIYNPDYSVYYCDYDFISILFVRHSFASEVTVQYIYTAAFLKVKEANSLVFKCFTCTVIFI